MSLAEINEMAKAVWNITEEKGFHRNRSRLEKIALVMSELGEAVEAERNRLPEFYFTDTGKPDGIAVELADAVIRIMDMFVTEGWDLEKTLRMKISYNELRSKQHGGKAY